MKHATNIRETYFDNKYLQSQNIYINIKGNRVLIMMYYIVYKGP